jgi:hypothetical protein
MRVVKSMLNSERRSDQYFYIGVLTVHELTRLLQMLGFFRGNIGFVCNVSSPGHTRLICY